MWDERMLMNDGESKDRDSRVTSNRDDDPRLYLRSDANLVQPSYDQ